MSDQPATTQKIPMSLDDMLTMKKRLDEAMGSIPQPEIRAKIATLISSTEFQGVCHQLAPPVACMSEETPGDKQMKMNVQAIVHMSQMLPEALKAPAAVIEAAAAGLSQ